MIKESHILLDKDFLDKNELFKSISDFLYSRDIVKEGYFEALIEREIDFPTGLPVKYGVAIPHLSSDYSNENAIIYVRLKNSIEFVEMGSDDQKVDINHVFFLVLKEGQDHLEILTKLIDLIQDEEFLDYIATVTSQKDLKVMLKEKIGGV